MIESNLDMPNSCILGIHYSGMHDSSISVIDQNGKVIYASSLERLTRIKQDSRFPNELIKLIAMDKVQKIAFTNLKCLPQKIKFKDSNIHPLALKQPRRDNRKHSKIWLEQINKFFPSTKKVFFSHHLAHASSSFYMSGLDNAICLVYDGGMYNEYYFGGVYVASHGKELVELDLFNVEKYANVSFLYLVVTTILGFVPMKHEGKITGLAAIGKVNEECKKILNDWLVNTEQISSLFTQWKNMYDENIPSSLGINYDILGKLQLKLAKFNQEDIAASVQNIAEEHILKIIENIKKLNIKSKNICLSGGLFANVKINQKISEKGFQNIFIAPPMGDDGTSLGAAFLALPKERRPKKFIGNIYFGHGENKIRLPEDIKKVECNNSSKFLAEKLNEGKICAVYQGNSEFGPRALGNRTILASATKKSINDGLNQKLSRTEFMPFAPVIRDINAKKYFKFKSSIRNAMNFMTITTNCTELAVYDCPAVVHTDNTARPQIVTSKSNTFIYNVLKNYEEVSSKFALVNTSFNIHEEPIVDNSSDAIKAFFEAGLDYLYLDGSIISLKDNLDIERKYLKDKLQFFSKKYKNAITEIKKLNYTTLKYEERNKDLEAHAKMYEERNKDLEAQIKKLNIKINSFINKYELIKNSKSWRYTKFIRDFISILRIRK